MIIPPDQPSETTPSHAERNGGTVPQPSETRTLRHRTSKKVRELIFSLAVAIPVGLAVWNGAWKAFAWVDESLSDTFGNESLKTKTNRAVKKISGSFQEELLDRSPEGSRLIPLSTKRPEIYYHIGKKEKSDASIMRMQIKIEIILGLFPDFLVRENLDYVVIGNIKQTAEENVDLAYADRKNRIMRFHSFEETYPRLLERDGLIAIGDVAHEMTHLVFMHNANKYYEKLWEKEFWTHRDEEDFAPHFLAGGERYGRRNHFEDMATVAEFLFSEAGCATIYEYAEKSPVLVSKIKRIKALYAQKSRGLMDDEYFEKIRSGKIRSGTDAQKYFLSKRA